MLNHLPDGQHSHAGNAEQAHQVFVWQPKYRLGGSISKPMPILRDGDGKEDEVSDDDGSVRIHAAVITV